MKLMLTAIILLLSCITGCAAPTRYSMAPELPVTLPFAVDKAGATVSTDLRIVKNLPNGEPYGYISTLHFEYKQNDSIDRQRVRKLVDKWWDKSGNIHYPVISSIPLRLKISALDSFGNERVVSDKTVYLGEESGFSATYFSRYVEERLNLSAGLYRVTIQSLRDVPELAGTTVTFGIYYPHGK
jgi:hypothetical protein